MSALGTLPTKTTFLYMVIFSFVAAMIAAGATQFSSLPSERVDWNAPLQCEPITITKISAFHPEGAVSFHNDVWALKGSSTMHFNSIFVWSLGADQELPKFIREGSRRKIEYLAAPYWRAYANSFANQFELFYLFHIPALKSTQDQNIWYGQDEDVRSSLFCQSNRPLAINGESLCGGPGWMRDFKSGPHLTEGKRYLVVAFDNQEPIVQERVIPFVRRCYYSDFRVEG